jgi:hypothetical protein
MLSLIEAHGQEFDEISAINITKQDNTKFVIQPDFLVEEGYKSFSNDVIQENKLILTPGESIKISYKSPCGYANSIEGFFLKGTADISISSLSSTGPIQSMDISGEQKEFYKNQNPEKEAIEIASVPSDIEISAIQSDEAEDDNKLVFVMDCDEAKIYYIAEAEIR